MHARTTAAAGLAVLATLATAPAAVADEPDRVTAELTAGTLAITGTDGADAIGLALQGDALRVAVRARDLHVPLAGLDRVTIAPGAGADRVAVDDLGDAVFNGVETDLGADGEADEVTLTGSPDRDFMDLVTLAAVSTAVNVLKNAARRNRGRGGLGGIVAGVVSAAAGLLEVLWTEASYLILPAMIIEDMSLKDSARRVAQIVKDNLLLVGISTVGVRAVTGLIGFVLGFAGLVIGFGIGYGIIAVVGSGTFGLILGVGLGLMVFLFSTMVASVISSYTTTAYHTCLYLWARNVEVAQTAGQPMQVAAPAPLAAVLGSL